MPYRVDIRNVADDALDRLVELGAIDAESEGHGEIAALMPDSVAAEQIASALGVGAKATSPCLPPRGATPDPCGSSAHARFASDV